MSDNPGNKEYVSDEIVYEEMSRLNNQLANMHRELAKKNSALEKLKRELEERVKELEKVAREHSKIEQQLRKSEELHRIILTNLSDTVLITNKAGTFTYVCPNVNIIFGFSQDEVLDLYQTNLDFLVHC